MIGVVWSNGNVVRAGSLIDEDAEIRIAAQIEREDFLDD
jgi:hypothetical protein